MEVEMALHFFDCQAQRRMYEAGFIQSTCRQPCNQDAMIFDYVHKDNGARAQIILTGLEIMRDAHSEEKMRALADAKCAAVTKSTVHAAVNATHNQLRDPLRFIQQL